MEQLMPTVASWCLAAGVVVLGVLLIRQRWITARLRRRNREWEGLVHDRDEEVRHLVATRLPSLAEPIYHPPAQVPGLGREHLAGTKFGHDLEQVLAMFSEAGDKALARADKSAQAALRTVMKTVQSLANEQQLAISTMQAEHDNPEVLEGLLEIDHANAQLSRRAQAIAVLCGSWAGRQRSAATLTDVVRGATSRIRNYLRVQVHAQVDTAVVSWAVEPVVLTVAELLDNAARYSAPTTVIEVNFQAAHHGMAIMVDDAGVGMDADARERAMQVLSAGRRSVDITALGDPPQVGFAVIGVLAARYGFSVSVDTTSPYGGARAVVFLPTKLLTHIEHSDASPTTSISASSPSQNDEPSPPKETTSTGLPKRRRREPVAEASSSAQPSHAAQPLSGRPARQTAAGLGAWQRGTRTGRGTTPTDTEGTHQI